MQRHFAHGPLRLATAALLLTLGLAGCGGGGGGGGGGGDSPTNAPGTWDKMQWDKDRWSGVYDRTSKEEKSHA